MEPASAMQTFPLVVAWGLTARLYLKRNEFYYNAMAKVPPSQEINKAKVNEQKSFYQWHIIQQRRCLYFFWMR